MKKIIAATALSGALFGGSLLGGTPAHGDSNMNCQTCSGASK